MKKYYSILLLLCMSGLTKAQLSISGNVTANSVANNAPAVIVDNTITISGSGTINSAQISIATNFSSGDILSFTVTPPAGVSGSYNASTGVLSFSGSATLAEYQALLRNVKFNTTSSSTSQRKISFNIGSAIAFSDNGHFYEYVADLSNWSTAKTAAEARTFYGLQGYLATITSANENEFIRQKVAADAWIGCSDDYTFINAATGSSTYANQGASEGHWYWVTGPSGEKGTEFSSGNINPVSVSGRYMNWTAGEPNNIGTEHYGEIYCSNATGKWNDLGGSANFGYVVEYGGMAGDPAVTLSCSRFINMIASSLTISGGAVVYKMHDIAQLVDPNITCYSTSTITDARVTVSGNFVSGDELSYTAGALPGGVSGSYNGTTGVLSFTGTATASQWQTLFRSVKFNSSSGTLGNRTVTFSLGSLVSSSNGHFYEHISSAASWTTAKANAAARTYLGLNGYLATITSQAENDFIKQKTGADAWIGASDEYTQINAATGASTYANQAAAEGKWYWVTGPAGEKGTQFSNGNITPAAVNGMFNNWNNAEPNNSGSNEHYGELYASGGNPGKWNDLPNNSLGYIVEYGGLDTDPLLQLSTSQIVTISSFLAITGLDLSLAKVPAGIQIKWSTRSELHSDHFEILYSTDGNQYTMLKSTPATGSISQGGQYQWIHTNPASGTLYYRIKEVAMDGKETLSAVKTIVTQSLRLKLSPNPVKDQLQISYPGNGQVAQVQIRNYNGVVVWKQQGIGNPARINISRLPQGVYHVEVLENGVSYQGTIIKD